MLEGILHTGFRVKRRLAQRLRGPASTISANGQAHPAGTDLRSLFCDPRPRDPRVVTDCGTAVATE